MLSWGQPWMNLTVFDADRDKAQGKHERQALEIVIRSRGSLLLALKNLAIPSIWLEWSSPKPYFQQMSFVIHPTKQISSRIFFLFYIFEGNFIHMKPT